MADFPTELLDLPATRAAAAVALAYLDDAAAAAARLSHDVEPEALHDFRVAIRRLRVTLRGYPRLGERLSTKQRRRLRKLARLSNPARDTEVQIAWFRERTTQFTRGERAALGRLRARLGARRRRELASIQRTLQRWFAKLERKLRRRLREMSSGQHDAPFRAAAAATLAQQATELSSRLRDALPAASAADLHMTRIAAKRLRYLLEPIATAVTGGKVTVQRLKALQEILGELTDGHELATALDEEDRGSVTHTALQILRGEAEAAFAKLRQDWSEAGPELKRQIGAIVQQLRPAAKAPPSMRQRAGRPRRGVAR
jgi:CHAD domain-containing protein